MGSFSVPKMKMSALTRTVGCPALGLASQIRSQSVLWKISVFPWTMVLSRGLQSKTGQDTNSPACLHLAEVFSLPGLPVLSLGSPGTLQTPFL